MNKRKIRDILKLVSALLFFWLYLPHLMIFIIRRPTGVTEDMKVMGRKLKIQLPLFLTFLYYIHNNCYYRNIFYHRIGPVFASMIGWWRPGNKYLVISKTTELGGGVELIHPFSTVIHADRIGSNFSFRNGTVVGEKPNGRPTIGNNVTLAPNVCVIGKVTIGDNAFIGAGSIVTKDIPPNCVAAGNPARVIKYL